MIVKKAHEIRTGWRFREPEKNQFHHASIISNCGDRNYVHLNAECYHRDQPLIVPDRDIQ